MRTAAGFSIIELMIAMVIGLLVTIAASSVFVQSKRSYVQNEELARTQENGRFAIKLLQRDLSMAGFIGQMLGGPTGFNIGKDAALNLTPACGLASQLTPVQDLVNLGDGQTVNDVTNKFPCINDHLAGTDAVAIKRVADNPTCTVNIGAGGCGHATTAPDNPDQIYLLTNGVVGWLHDDSALDSPAGDAAAALAPRSDWEYYVYIYYIRSFSNAGDGIPTLCRKALGVQGGQGDELTTECLAEGIEDLQIELGVDPDNDSIPDFYTGTPTVAQSRRAVTVKFYVLARSVELVPGINNDATYTVGGVARGPFNDRYLRRVYSSSAQMRNIDPL